MKTLVYLIRNATKGLGVAIENICLHSSADIS